MGNARHVHGPVTTAKDGRFADGGLIAVQGPTAIDTRTGVLWGPGSTALVTGTATTAPMTVAIAPHHWVTTRGSANGPYLGALEAATTATIPAAPAAGAGTRIDVVYSKQQDAQPGIPAADGTNAPLYGVVSGVAGGAKPALPVGAEEIATVSVSPGATSTGGANVVIANTARQTVARGADIPVRNQAERDAFSPFWPLLTFKRLDTGAIERRNAANSGWETVYTPDDGTWTTYTSTWTAATAAPSLGNGTLISRCRLLSAKTVQVRIFLSFGSTTNGGTGALSFGLPFPAVSDGSFQALLVGGYTSDGKAWSGKADIAPGASLCQPQLPKGPTPDLGPVAGTTNGSAGTGVPLVPGAYTFLSGSSLSVTGTYERA